MKISEQTVLVTGGGRGLGHAIVRAFAQQDARMVINYLRSREPAEALAREYGAHRAIALQADEQGASWYRIVQMYEEQQPDNWRVQAILYA